MGNKQSQEDALSSASGSIYEQSKNPPKNPSIKLIDSEKKVDELIDLTNINHPVLLCIIQKQPKQALAQLSKIKKEVSPKQFHAELLMAFWFAIHQEDIHTASILMENEYVLKQLVVCCLQLSRMQTSQKGDTETINKNTSMATSKFQKGTIHGQESQLSKANSEALPPQKMLKVEQNINANGGTYVHAKTKVRGMQLTPEQEGTSEEEDESSSGEEQESSSSEEMDDSKNNQRPHSTFSSIQSSVKDMKSLKFNKEISKQVEPVIEESSEEGNGSRSRSESDRRKKKQKDDSSEEDSADDERSVEQKPKKNQPKQRKGKVVNSGSSDSDQHEGGEEESDQSSSASEPQAKKQNSNKQKKKKNQRKSSSDSSSSENSSSSSSSESESSQERVPQFGGNQQKQNPPPQSLSSSQTSKNQVSKSETSKSSSQASKSQVSNSKVSNSQHSNSQPSKSEVSKSEVSKSQTSKSKSEVSSSMQQQRSKPQGRNIVSSDRQSEDESDSSDGDEESSSDEDVTPQDQMSQQYAESPMQLQQQREIVKKVTLGQVLKEAKIKKQRDEELKEIEDDKVEKDTKFQAMGITPDMVENTTIPDRNALFHIKYSLRTKFEQTMSNILKIALKRQEEKIACLIISYYELILDDEILVLAVTQNMYQCMMFIWGFNKNFIGSRFNSKSTQVGYQHLIDLVKKQHQHNQPEQIEIKIRQILDWKLYSTENILIALLYHRYDQIALEYMGYYSHLLNEDLLMFTLNNGNTDFMKVAMVKNAFDKLLFREENIIMQMIQVLQEGHRLYFLLNVLNLVDFGVWKNKYLKEIVDTFESYYLDHYEHNRLILSSNPLMSIALCAEILSTISIARRKYENECLKVNTSLMALGKLYISKIEQQKYFDSLMLDTDFRNRSVLKIITYNGFEPLMNQNDPKAENLITSFWQGRETHKCDGNVYGYSSIAHIALSKPKKAVGSKHQFLRIITNQFNANFDVDYSFQYVYRQKQISFLFYQEFFFACLLLIFFQLVNYQYLTDFSDYVIKGTNNDTLTDPSPFDVMQTGAYPMQVQLYNVQQSKEKYEKWNFINILLSMALLLQFFMRVLFNAVSKTKLRIDKWVIMETLTGILNLIALYLISKIVPSSYIIPRHKDYQDYFMIVVLCINWIRFFSFFLTIREVSKLILTLVQMIAETLAFLFITCCFILIMASIFTTLYQDENPVKYGSLLNTVVYLFNYAILVYDFNGMGNRIISDSLLTLFVTFFAGILLYNYLVAILSTTYQNMKETGIFRYKCNLYQYCERFLISFGEPAYGGLVQYAPPLSYVSFLMIPFMGCERISVSFQYGFSMFRYWYENVFLLFIFLVFELALLPIAFLRMWFHLWRNKITYLETFLQSLLLAIAFPMLLFAQILVDFKSLISLFCYTNGCKFGKADQLAEEVIDPNLKIETYNETRATCIFLYKKLKEIIKKQDQEEDEAYGEEKEQSQDEDEEGKDKQDFELEQEIDFFPIEQDDIIHTGEHLYHVTKTDIINEWKIRKRKLEIRERRRQLDAEQGTSANLNRILSQSLMKINRKSIQNKLSTDKGPKSPSSMTGFSTQAMEKQKVKSLGGKMKMAFIDALKKGMEAANADEDPEIDMSDFVILPYQVAVVEEFLSKFTLITESSYNEHVDVMIMLKALPNKVTMSSLPSIDLFTMKIAQESLMAYQNMQIVNAFEYFDDKNRGRVDQVKENIQDQRVELSKVSQILGLLETKINRNEEYNKAKQMFVKKASSIGRNEKELPKGFHLIPVGDLDEKSVINGGEGKAVRTERVQNESKESKEMAEELKKSK